jgi:hypothetical protein
LTSIREEMITDILSRYGRVGRHGRYALLLAFGYTKGKLELENGDFADWCDEDKNEISHQLLRIAEELYGDDPDWACGAGLLSLYLEAQTFPGEQAKRMVMKIDNWYRHAAENELSQIHPSCRLHIADRLP